LKPYYDRDGITLYHADCRNVLPCLDVIDVIDVLLTDPPYNIKVDRCGGHMPAKKEKETWRHYGDTNWDHSRPPASIFTLMLERTWEQIIWAGNYRSDYLRPFMRWLFWDQSQQNFALADREFAWNNQRKAARIYSFSRSKALQDGKVHPIQKPLTLMEWCLGFAKGITLLACRRSRIRAIGIPLSNEKWSSLIDEGV
jgi:DNA modification methylase